MMKTKIKYFVPLIIICLSFTSCFEDDEYGSDTSKVTPAIFDFTGDAIAFVDIESIYSVTPRGGSEYIWSVTGVDADIYSENTEQVTITFNDFGTATVSVYEITSNGLSSEISSMEVTVLGTPCTYSIDMQDDYGDGWNGANLTFSFDGTETIIQLETGSEANETIDIPDGSDFDITFNSGDWDIEVTFQIYNASGEEIISGGPSPNPGTIYSGTNSCP